MRRIHRSVAIALTALSCEGTPPANTPPSTTPIVVAKEPSMTEPSPSAAPAVPSATEPVAISAPTNPPPSEAAPPPEPPPAGPPRACGRMPGERIERVTWAHGNGDAKCDALETRWANVPHRDRACRSDDECIVIAADGNCILLPLTKKAATRAEYQTPPCGNPRSGACPGGRSAARCVDGCCAAR
jgi:hypothetical protein